MGLSTDPYKNIKEDPQYLRWVKKGWKEGLRKRSGD